MDTDIGDIKTSDEEQEIAKKHVESFKKQKVVEREKEGVRVNDISQMFLECHSEYDDSVHDMDTGVRLMMTCLGC